MKTWFSVLYTIVYPFFNLFHPCRAIGRANIPDGAALVCANHTTISDPFFVIFALTKKNRVRIMAKAEVMRIPVLNWILKKVGVFGVDRGNRDVGAIKEGLRCLKNGEKLLLFPEGTRIKSGEGGPGKTGAAMLALRTGVPILPVYMPAKKRWFRPTPVVIGEPFYPKCEGAKANADDYERVAAELMGRIFDLEKLAV